MAADPATLMLLANGGIELLQWLNGSSSNNAAADALTGGLNSARESVRGAYGQAREQLNPYAQMGQQDFQTFRNAAQSGYFETPYSGTYTTPQYQNQGFNPGAYNPATGSYNQSYSPYQTQQMTFGQPSLPPMPPMAPPQQAPQQSQEGQPGRMSYEDMLNLIREMARGNMSDPSKTAVAQRMPNFPDQVRRNQINASYPSGNEQRSVQEQFDSRWRPYSPTNPMTLQNAMSLYRIGRSPKGEFGPYA